MSKQPDIKLKSNISYGLEVAGWVGERGASFKINKRYKNKETQEWQNTDWLNTADLAALHFLISEAITQAKELESERRERYNNNTQFQEEIAKQEEVTNKQEVVTTYAQVPLMADDDIPF